MYLKDELYELLRSDESIFGFIQDTALDGLWYWDLENPENEWMNAKFWLVLGYDPDDMPHKSSAWQGIINQDDLKAANENFTKHCENPEHPYDQIVRYKHKNGSTVWVRCRGMAIRDENGKAIRMLGAHHDLTERKKHEEQLELQAEILDQIVDHVSVTDLNGKILYANKTECNSIGLTKGQVIGKSIEIFGEDEAQGSTQQEILEATLETGAWRGEVINYDKEGNLNRILDCRTTLLVDSNNDPKGLIGVASDITGRKQAVEALSHSHELMKYIIEHTRSAVAVHDKDMKYIYVSQRYIDDYKIQDKDIIGKHHYEVFPDLPKKWKDVHQKALAGEVLSAEDDPYVREDGSMEWTRWECRPWFEKDGSIGGIIVYTEVITERKRTEKELEIFKTIAENSVYGKAIADMDGNLVYVNDYFARIHDYKKEELIGKNLSVLHNDHQRKDVEGLIGEMMQTGYFAPTEVWHIKRDGTEFPTLMTGVTVKDEIRNTTFLASTAIDITLQKQTEADLIKAKKQAEESDRLKSAFLANMSHEIRTPMNGILGFAELLKEPDLNSHKQKQYISVIEKSGKRMLNIINDIVDISRIEAGYVELSMGDSDINEIIREVFAFFKPEAEAKAMKLSLKTHLSSQESTIRTDREKIFAVLANLVKNAIKYTEKGEIELGLVRNGAFLEFYVKDTGIGIPGDRQEAIFERFVQADIEDRMAREGAGLGLAISKAYVEMLGGEIWVESEEGVGSTFRFTVPCISESASETTQRQTEQPDTKAKIRRLKTLIVDDDEMSALFLEEVIKAHSVEVLKASTGFEAVRICSENPDLDLILMDIRMPDMDGYEATKKIREFNKEVVIISQTAHGLVGDRQKSMDAGCDDYISKPIDRDQLLVLMEKHFA